MCTLTMQHCALSVDGPFTLDDLPLDVHHLLAKDFTWTFYRFLKLFSFADARLGVPASRQLYKVRE